MRGDIRGNGRTVYWRRFRYVKGGQEDLCLGEDYPRGKT